MRLLVSVCLALLSLPAVVVAQSAPVDCQKPEQCRELALEARARGAYETFHDLAWRAVQTGRPNDPDLMYLLARAQALSGRRRDAAVMLRRLAEAGVATDAATDEDLRRVRELPEWPYIAELTERARSAAAASAPVAKPPAPAAVAPPKAASAPPAPVAVTPPKTAAAPSAPVVTPPKTAAAPPAPAAVTPPKTAAAPPATAAVRNTLRVEKTSVEETARFSTRPFVPGGFAYDAASQRLLFGDVTGRRLFVVGDGSARTTDLVSAESAGFDDVTAIAVDPKRGELWVASSRASESGALHRLQLISGRALAKLPVPGDGPMRLIDAAVTGDGTVLILDSATARVFVRRPGATTVALLMLLKAPDPVSIAASDDGRSVYVANREGITHIDVPSRRARPLGAAKGIALGGFAFIRWHRDGLVGSQLQPDGSPGLVRLRLDRDQTSVRQATLAEDPASSEGQATFAAVSGDDLYYVVAERPETLTSGAPLTDVRVKRVTLR